MSTIVATSRPMEGWEKILEDNAATSAFLDDANIFSMKEKNYRLKNKNTEKKN